MGWGRSSQDQERRRPFPQGPRRSTGLRAALAALLAPTPTATGATCGSGYPAYESSTWVSGSKLDALIPAAFRYLGGLHRPSPVAVLKAANRLVTPCRT